MIRETQCKLVCHCVFRVAMPSVFVNRHVLFIYVLVTMWLSLESLHPIAVCGAGIWVRVVQILSTARYSYNAMNFLQNPYNRHSIARP